jgi:hypothetical protein
MNAYELADKLDWHWDNDCRSPAISKSADMLRQQADRIAELEKQLDIQFQYGFKAGKLEEWKANKLFTPQTKPLTDEEIIKILNGIEYSQAEIETSFNYEIRIARAIEAKVREEK